ncbi:MAG: type II toxin-antitoxin system Phd/YefM family antitoxin [Caldisericum sp.]|jgi:PHD/YefM family antitoxin component YafN of YafNO toxin-antitoxin module|nr:type II toxin-antitoxin system Phd/YefM family antitoxin [Caldisericum sp.]
MLRSISASNLKRDLLKVLDNVEKGDAFAVIRKGKIVSVLIDYETFEAMREAYEILGNKELLKKFLDEG